MNIIISSIVFMLSLIFNYIGAVGRIERKNQYTKKFQETGPVSKKEEIAFFEGKHKKLAFIQSLTPSIILGSLVFLILNFVL